MMIPTLFFLAFFLGWHLGKPKKKYPVEMEPDEPCPRIAEGMKIVSLMGPGERQSEPYTEAVKKWEAEQNRKEGLRYAGNCGKKDQNKGKRNRKGPADKADGQGAEVGGG